MDNHIRLRLDPGDAAAALVLSKNGDAALLYAFCLAQGGLGESSRAMEALAFDADRLKKAFEVLKLYGIAESTLEKMRAANRGPAYSQLTAKGKILYSRKAIDTWFEIQAITPRAI